MSRNYQLYELQLKICRDKLRECDPSLLKEVNRAPKHLRLQVCKQLLNECNMRSSLQQPSPVIRTTEGLRVFTPAGQLVALTGNVKGYQHLRKAEGKKSRKTKKRGNKKRRKTLYKKKGKKMQKRRRKTKSKSKKGGSMFTRRRFMRPRRPKYGNFQTRRTQQQKKQQELCDRLETEKKFEPQERMLRFQKNNNNPDELVDPHTRKLNEGFDWYDPSGICGPGYYTDEIENMKE